MIILLLSVVDHRSKKLYFVVLVLSLFLVPMAQGFTIDGPTNFVYGTGGNVRFDDSTTSTYYQIVNAVSRFTSIRDNGGPNRGTLGFDCQDGVNMTILGIGQYQIQYSVATALPGAVTTTVYYANNDHLPVGTNTDTVTFNAVTDTTTVTTTGNVIVTLDYAPLTGGTGFTGLELMWSLFPLVALVSALQAKKYGFADNRIVAFALVFAVSAFILFAITALGV